MPVDQPDRFPLLAGIPVADLLPVEVSWQARFLSRPVMARLTPRHWQDLLQGMVLDHAPADTTVVESGMPVEHCLVIRQGRARVHRGRRTVAILGPGDLFGVVALIGGIGHRESVTLLTDASIGCLSATIVQRSLLAVAVPPLDRREGRLLVWIDSSPPAEPWVAVSLPDLLERCWQVPAETGLPLLPGAEVAVGGGVWRERQLAAYLLAERGVDALPLGDRTGAAN